MVWNPLKALTATSSSISIDLKDAHHVYRPGESVVGSVIVELGKAASKATILVNFKGRLKLRARKPQIRAQESVMFNERVVLFEDQPLSQGKHAFPFELELPREGLLETVDFDMGNISYVIRGSLSTTKAVEESALRSVKVAINRDVVHLSAPKTVSLLVDTSRKRKQNKKVVVKLSMPHKGWTPGEHIPIKLFIQHQWDVQSPAAIAVTLSRISQLVVGSSEYTYRKDLDQSILGLYTDPASRVAELTTNLIIPPDSLISATSQIISFSYLIEATVDLSGKTDLGDWANSNPAIKMIDTDRVRKRPGVVSSWAEIIVGTHRSDPGSREGSRVEINSEVIQTANADAPSSLESSDQLSQSRHSSSHSFSPPSTNSDTAASTEKMVLATRAQTLIPSVPEYPTPQQSPSAPPIHDIHHQPPLPSGSGNKETIRLQQLASEPMPDSAPAYTPREVHQSPSLAVSAPPLSTLTVSAPPAESLHPSTSSMESPVSLTSNQDDSEHTPN